MNGIVNKFLLAGDRFTPEMHLSMDLLTVLANHILKTKKELSNIKIKYIGGSSYIYQNELDKACFQYDMAYVDFKVLKKCRLPWLADEESVRF